MPKSVTLSRADVRAWLLHMWERRGRGVFFWDHPVEPEPAFARYFKSNWFVDQFIRFAKPETWAHLLIRSFVERRYDISRTIPSYAPIIGLYKYSAKLFRSTEKIVEFQIQNAGKAYPKHVFVDFLQNLKGVSHPINYELIATSDGLVRQFSCRSSDAEHVATTLREFFPDAHIKRTSDYFDSLVHPADDRFVVTTNFGLQKILLIPLQTSEHFEDEPLTVLEESLKAQTPDALNVVQVHFAPAKHPWGDEVLRAARHFEDTPFSRDFSPFRDVPDLWRLSTEKTKSETFFAVVRSFSVARGQQEASTACNRVRTAFTQFDAKDRNHIRPEHIVGDIVYPAEALFYDVQARVSRQTGMLLNAHELADLVHFPRDSVQNHVPRAVEPQTPIVESNVTRVRQLRPQQPAQEPEPSEPEGVSAPPERTVVVDGYAVRVSYSVPSKAEQEARHDAVAKQVVGSMKRRR